MEDLKFLKKKRAALRAAVTRLMNEAEAARSAIDMESTNAKVFALNRKSEELKIVDGSILDLMCASDDYTEDELGVESTDAERYTEKIFKCVQKMELSKSTSCTSEDPAVRVKLPKLELRTFDGKLEEWLGWWAHFEKIHSAPMDEAEKFQYLLQAVVGSARELVLGFPPTADNYPKVIQTLKERYGNNDMLGELYTRDLLALCFRQSRTTKQDIQYIFDKVETALRSLESLKIKMDECAPILTPLVESTLPDETLRTFRRNLPSDKQSSKDRLTYLLGFLKKEIETEQRVQLAAKCFDVTQDRAMTAQALLISNEATGCLFCGATGHASRECRKALRMSMEEKKAILLKKGGCFACTETRHIFKNCKLSEDCRSCKKRHVRAMCPLSRQQRNAGKPKGEPPITGADSATTEKTVVALGVSDCSIVLPTILIPIRGRWGQVRITRALCDSGSQRSYILKSVAEKLSLQALSREKLAFELFSGVKSPEQEMTCFLAPVESKSFKCDLELLGTEIITSYSTPIEVEKFFDGEVHMKAGSGPIEVLIGADYFGAILTGRRKKIDKHLTALETEFGWTVLGKTAPREVAYATTVVSLMTLETDLISNFWRLETLGIVDNALPCNEKDEALRRLQENLKYEKNRYAVPLPWRDSIRPPSNRELAERRLRGMTRHLSPQLFREYDTIFKDWAKSGIIEPAEDSDCGHFLPHRPVIREASDTTRVRPVFDASARRTISLNDALIDEPNFIELILAILMRFRQNKYGLCADIEKAFLQIEVLDTDRDFLKFLWWNQDGEIVAFRHTRVVFGLKPSPFILCGVIKLHLLRMKEQGTPELHWVISKLNESFYMDDLICSVSTKEDVLIFKRYAAEIMSAASMTLRKWSTTEEGAAGEQRVLGLTWYLGKDELSLNLNWWSSRVETMVITKRVVLSFTQKIFDPLGFAAPVTVAPRRLLQVLWRKKIEWDTPLEEEEQKTFKRWYDEIRQLELVRVPRWFGNGHLSLHVFCDASRVAYAAVIFLRIEKTSKEVDIRFVSSKARIAPEGVSIPRLELLAVLVGARLLTAVRSAMRWENLRSIVWTDSMTVVQWIQRDENWSVFVRNRVAEIRKHIGEGKIVHVPGDRNPADVPSRGCSAKKLVSMKWWDGPEWLKDRDSWPQEDESTINEEEIGAERKRSSPVLLNTHSALPEVDFLLKYSSYGRMSRVVAWMYRFIDKCRRLERIQSELTAKELEHADKRIFGWVQRRMGDDKRLQLLNVIEENGLIKLRTRVLFRVDSELFRSPIILPGDDEIVRRYVRWTHEKNGHVGAIALLSILRENVWILGGRRLVRSVVRSCVICKRFREKRIEQPLPPLPENRVRDAVCFEICGVDFAGPLMLRGGGKAWICLFTCAVYRAVHLELCLSLSTECFLQAFRCFVARRGRPSVIYSDRGTNFVGAANALKGVDWDEVNRYSSGLRIQWIFNPPSAPWWGGWWERLVGVMKQILRRVLGRACLSFQELYAVLCEAESLMNHRPLSFVENDGEIEPIAPFMFLTDLKEDGVPEVDPPSNSEGLARRARFLVQLRRDLRSRFRSEYLGFLRSPRPARDERPLSVGDVVLIGDDNTKPINFPLARIVDLKIGRDGVARTAELRTAKGIIVRPVQRLYPLEVYSTTDEPFVTGNVKLIRDVVSPEKRDTDNSSPWVNKRGRVIRRPARYL